MMEPEYILRNFLDGDGKLKSFPAKRKMKVCALIYLARFFEPERDFTEAQINDILLDHHTFADPATLRRELYEYHFLDRSRDGKVYRLARSQPTVDELGL